MGGPISSPGDYFYKLRSNLIRNDDRLRCVLSTITNGKAIFIAPIPDLIRNGGLSSSILSTLSKLNSKFVFGIVSVEDLDRMLWRAEKIPELHDILARIIEVSICPALRTYNLYESCHMRVMLYVRELSFTLDYNWLRNLNSAISQAAVSATESLESAYIVFIRAVVLSIVYQYLIGYVDRGGTKTYNSGSLEFRATYISLLLFQGAYVWIKFRDVVSKRAVYRRSRKEENGEFQYYGKYEPRFKPPREKDVVTRTVLKFNCLPLGGYDTRQDAEVVCQIAGFYYGKDDGTVELEDGAQFSIPAMSEQERDLRGEEKRKWVSVKAKEVYKELKEEEAARRQPRSNNLIALNVGEAMDAPNDPPPADQGVEFSTATSNLSDAEFVNFLSELAEVNGPLVSLDSEILLNDFLDDIQVGFEGVPTIREGLDEELNLQKEQLEAEFNRRIEEQHVQHLQSQQRLEEQILELRRENEHMKSVLHKVMKPLRSHFATSTEI